MTANRFTPRIRAKPPAIRRSSRAFSLAPAEGERGGVRGLLDALREIDRFFKADHAVIIPLTVREILDEQIARKLV